MPEDVLMLVQEHTESRVGRRPQEGRQVFEPLRLEILAFVHDNGVEDWALVGRNIEEFAWKFERPKLVTFRARSVPPVRKYLLSQSLRKTRKRSPEPTK